MCRPVPAVSKCRPVTKTFVPSMAFKLMATSAQKRAWTQWHHFRDYKERTGSPLKYSVPGCVQEEMTALRNRIYELESGQISAATDRVQASLRAITATLAMLEGKHA